MAKSVYIAQTNCITPLGFDVEGNIAAISAGKTGITHVNDTGLMPQTFYGAVIDDEKLDNAFAEISSDKSYTRLEKMMLLALHPIIKSSGILPDDKTALLLSTTKGNITLLNDDSTERPWLDNLAKTIADFFGFVTEPIVVSNACVSGIMAISVAKRLLQAGIYDHAFVVGGDEVSEFVLSGFNSFQAMSEAPCKPYSANRTGVNLGEAAAVALVTIDDKNAIAKITGDGSVNDANHISGPSRTGEGLVRSIQSALSEANITSDKIDYISAHGTATPFNDEMEAVALNRLSLQDVPVNSFKGYYGHTLGASGLLEMVIGLESMRRGELYASAGYDEQGVSQPINVITENKKKEVAVFLKTASGFGGCNTAVLFEKTGNGEDKFISDWCLIENNRVALNGQTVFEAPGLPFADFAKQAYQHAETGYAKFFKMDNLSKLAFLTADFLLKNEVKEGEENNIALLFANKSSSLDTDVKHHESIADRENYFPSPAVFVYTLPNICMGEISIRYKLYTENSFFIFAQFNAEFFANYADILMDTGKADKVLCGWVEFYKDNYKAFMYLVSDSGTMEHTQQNIQKLYNE